MASAWTFSIPPIQTLLRGYVWDGIGWADPFAGVNLIAEFSNDANPEGKAPYHMEAEEFVRGVVPDGLTGALFDPPYSNRQISDHYKGMGKHMTQQDTKTFYSRVRNPLASKVRPGGWAISFGWNSTGFGKSNGFELVEILLVNHAGNERHDTIVTVEQKAEHQPLAGFGVEEE